MNTKILLNEIIKSNNIDLDDITSIIFTATNDIDAVYPAVSARELGIVHAGLMCVQEMYVKDSLKMCVRILINIDSNLRQKDVNHVYLKGAVKLRPDLAKKNFISIAIDGPAGSGKSTVAKEISKTLGYIYVDTGAMYRSVALYCLDNGIDTKDDFSVESVLDNINIELKYINGEQRIYLNGDDVTSKIRTQDVAKGSSDVAAIKRVREVLVDTQRKIAKSCNVVMDGRDIGTCVLPDATVKIYMDAEISERTKRRCGELKEKGIVFDFDKVKQEITQRDENDKNREFSPLKMADDAIFFDSTYKTAEEVKNEIINIINERF
jgi:cytidylate kinase